MTGARSPGYYWAWLKVGGSGSGPPGRLTIAEFDPSSEEHPRQYPWTIVGNEDIFSEDDLVIAGPIERPRFCVMRVGQGSLLESTPDVECGKVGAYCFRGDPDHICCEGCYEQMRSHDPGLLLGYVALVPSAEDKQVQKGAS